MNSRVGGQVGRALISAFLFAFSPFRWIYMQVDLIHAKTYKLTLISLSKKKYMKSKMLLKFRSTE